MTKKVLTTPVSDADIESLKIGDVFYLSGALITSRDMVHFRHVEEGMDLPYDLAGKAIFHAGPIMVPDDKSRSGFRVVSIGPTTSMRMEKYEREFLRKTGVKIVVGKGGIGPETAAGCQESKAVHCVFPGGCAVLAAECVEEVEERHWPELGQPRVHVGHARQGVRSAHRLDRRPWWQSLREEQGRVQQAQGADRRGDLQQGELPPLMTAVAGPGPTGPFPRKRKLKKPQKQKGPADRCGPQGLLPLCSVAGLP